MAQKKNKEAKKVKAAFEEAWRFADAEMGAIPEMRSST
jgi:hypothetical protein